MARRKPDPRDLPGPGIAAWSLLCALIDALGDKGVLSRQERIDVIDRALSSCERMHEDHDHFAFETARFLLEHLLRTSGGRRRAQGKSPRR